MRNFESSYATGGSTNGWSWNTQPRTQRHHESRTRVMERNDEEEIFRGRPQKEVLFGPEPPPKASRRPVGTIIIDGENLTARHALERYPQLREFLQQKGPLKEKSLQAKVQTWIREGKIPNHVFNPEPEIIPRRRLLGNNVVGHHTIHSEGNTSPRDFLNFTRNAVIRFLRERPQNKVQLSLICVMMRVDPATGKSRTRSKPRSTPSRSPCSSPRTWKPCTIG